MSQYQDKPREGMEALYLITHYLKKNPFRRIIFDPQTVTVDENVFYDGTTWVEFHGNVVEEDPPGMPEPFGKPVTITCFVDANHATNQVTRQSHTGIIIFLNKAPTIAFSKRQNTCESNTYGLELVAMRIARDLIPALRIKLESLVFLYKDRQIHMEITLPWLRTQASLSQCLIKSITQLITTLCASQLQPKL